MSNAWRIYQTQLALLREQSTPAPSWSPRRRVAPIRSQPALRTTSGGHAVLVTELVRLPGIQRPDAPLPVRAQ